MILGGVPIQVLDPFPARLHSIPAGITKRRLPLASVIALLMKLPLSPLAEVDSGPASSLRYVLMTSSPRC
jgi:hypothetical protein